MKSLEILENCITVLSGKNKLLENIILTQNQAWYIAQSG
jgi:hypothetical protein